MKITANGNIIVPLTGATKHHNWGKSSTDSIIAQIFPGLNLSQIAPIAEIWFGTHPLGEARVSQEESSIPLSVQLRNLNRPERLPYLAKILSIATPLSLQCHPDAVAAKELHDLYPEKYPDSNAKPELGIALTPTKILAGFRPFSELSELLNHPEYSSYLPSVGEREIGDLLSPLLHNLYSASDDEIFAATGRFLDSLNLSPRLALHVPLLKQIAEVYGLTDRGILIAPLLNIIELSPGDSIALAPGVLHAYLEGDVFECMAPSDNTIRGGITSKLIDSSSLCKCTRYEALPMDAITRVADTIAAHSSHEDLKGNQQTHCLTPVPGVEVTRIVQNSSRSLKYSFYPTSNDLLIGVERSQGWAALVLSQVYPAEPIIIEQVGMEEVGADLSSALSPVIFHVRMQTDA